MTKWMKLTRAELRGFDDKATELILAAMERGAVGRISTKGHCILRAPSGATMSVSRNTGMGNRGRYNMEAEFARIFGVSEVRALPRAVGDNETLSHPLVPSGDRPMLPCPLDSCDAEFVTGGARYTHIHKEHFPCREPGCGKVFKEKRGEQGHFNLKHTTATTDVKKCPVRGCGYENTSGGLGGHMRTHHPGWKAKQAARKKAAAAKKSPPKAPSSDSPKAVPAKAPSSDSFRLAMEALAKAHDEGLARAGTTRVAELEAEVAALRKHNAELEARLALLKEALEA